MRELEKQLRSWRPRRPSPSLETRIFGRKVSEDTARPRRAHWLVPAMAASMLICLVISQRSGPRMESSEEARRFAAIVVSNDSAPAYLAGAFQNEHNLLTARGLEWTNTGNSRPMNRVQRPFVQ
jgi:hypothetical protein